MIKTHEEDWIASVRVSFDDILSDSFSYACGVSRLLRHLFPISFSSLFLSVCIRHSYLSATLKNVEKVSVSATQCHRNGKGKRNYTNIYNQNKVQSNFLSRPALAIKVNY